MNYCIFRMEKLKSSSEVCNILKEQHRSEDYESQRADPEKSHLNLYSDNFEKAFEKFKELFPEKRRKNAVVGLNFVVTTSEEFKNEAAEILYYTKAVEFIGKNFGTVVGWAIHKDEKSTHLQAVTIPLVDGKLNARELVGGSKNRMREIQNSFFNEVGQPFGLLRGVEGSKAVHQTVEQKIRKEREELRKETEELQKQKETLEREKFATKLRQKSLFKEESDFYELVKKTTEKLNPEQKLDKQNIPDVVQAFEEALDKKTKKIKSVEAEQTLENNRLVLERQYLNNSAKAAADMVTQAKIKKDATREDFIEMLKTLAKGFYRVFEEAKKVLDAPLEKVEAFCREARKAGKKTLREFLFPKRELKNQEAETKTNTLSNEPKNVPKMGR